MLTELRLSLSDQEHEEQYDGLPEEEITLVPLLDTVRGHSFVSQQSLHIMSPDVANDLAEFLDEEYVESLVRLIRQATHSLVDLTQSAIEFGVLPSC